GGHGVSSGLVNGRVEGDDTRVHSSLPAPLNPPMSPFRHITIPRPVRAYFLFAALASVLPCAASAQRALKVYISVDMEGIAGVVTGDQLSPTGFEYGKARE